VLRRDPPGGGISQYLVQIQAITGSSRDREKFGTPYAPIRFHHATDSPAGHQSMERLRYGGGWQVMTVERWIRVIAGTFVLASVGLGWYVSSWFFLFTVFVGLNLFQSGWTNWCLMDTILKKLGVPEK
jgi:hypothetical protein